MTATPVLNNVTELFVPLTLVGNLTLNYSQFYKKYVKEDQASHFKKVIGVHNEIELKTLLHGHMLARSVTDAKLPEVRRYIHYLDQCGQSNLGPSNDSHSTSFSRCASTGYREETDQKQLAALEFLRAYSAKDTPFIVFFINLSNIDAFQGFPNAQFISG